MSHIVKLFRRFLSTKLFFSIILGSTIVSCFPAKAAAVVWCGTLFTAVNNPPPKSAPPPGFTDPTPPSSFVPNCVNCISDYTASPVFVGAGNYYLSVNDLSVPTRGFELAVSRNYDSIRPVDGLFGIGWTSNITVRLYYSNYLYQAPSTYTKEAVLMMPSGHMYRFKENADGVTYTSPVGSYESLIKNGDGSFDLTRAQSRAKFHFRTDGGLESIKDDYNNTINYSYDGNGRLTQISDGTGSGRYIIVNYGADGRISSLQDSATRSVIYQYDTDGYLTRVTDPASRNTDYSYVLSRYGKLLTRVTDHWGRIVSDITYDTAGRTATYTDSGEKFTYTYNYQSNPLQTSKTNLAGGLYVFIFNQQGQITSRKNPGLPVKTTTYYADGSPDLITDEVGIKTKHTYNANGTVATITRNYQGTGAMVRYDYSYDTNFPEKVIAIVPKNPSTGVRDSNWQEWRYDYNPPNTTAAGALWHVYRVETNGTTIDTIATYTYNPAGQVLSVTDASGAVTNYNYNSTTGDLISVTYPLNSDSGSAPVYQYQRDSLGRVTKVTDPLLHETNYVYDPIGRITSITLPKPSVSFPENFITTYTYDNFDTGTQTVYTTQTDPNAQITTQWFDQFGQMVKSRDALGKDTSFVYTKGLLSSITDANGNITSYSYNTARQLTKTTFPDGAIETYTYKTDGLLDVLTDRKGMTFQSYYDPWKRLTAINSPSGGSRTFTYTGQMLTQAANTFTGGGDTHTFGYDPSYRVNSHAQGTRGTITYTYNSNDRVATYSVSGGGPNTTYTYYADGSLRTITWSPVAGNFTYNYTLNGQYDLITFPNGQTRDYAYDDQGRLTQLTNIHPTVGNLATYSYGYDLNNAGGGYTMKGQRTTMTASVPSQNFINSATNYFYDNNYQLTKAIYPNVAPFSAEISEWTYDDIGNRTQSILNGTPTTYTYIPNGSTPPKNSQRLQNDGINAYSYDLNGNNTTKTGYTFTWDNRNEVFAISGTPALAYRYDFSGRRFRKTVGTTNYDYLYDGQNLIGQRTTGVQDFVFGPGIDEPLATKIGANIYYYSVDGLGSVALVTDTNGVVQNSYVYDAWGVTRSQSGSLANPFTYTSRESNEAGMLYYRARYYNPNTGGFISEDQYRRNFPRVGYGVFEVYRYARDPIRLSDPFGFFSVEKSCDCFPWGYGGNDLYGPPNESNDTVRSAVTEVCNYPKNQACADQLKSVEAPGMKMNLLQCLQLRCGDKTPIRCADKENCAQFIPLVDRPIFFYRGGYKTCPYSLGLGFGISLLEETIHSCGIAVEPYAYKDPFSKKFRTILEVCTGKKFY
jgi:RHS repeat-associated protein